MKINLLNIFNLYKFIKNSSSKIFLNFNEEAESIMGSKNMNNEKVNKLKNKLRIIKEAQHFENNVRNKKDF